jgi:hypothetical protein
MSKTRCFITHPTNERQPPILPLALICLALVAALVYEKHQNATREKEWALERGALLQRIQAPEVAVYENNERERKPVPVIPLYDDAAFHQAKKEMNGSGD